MLAATVMDQVVTSNRFPFLIGEQRKSVAGLLRQLPQFVGLIDADCRHANSLLVEGVEIPLNTPQLGVTDWSPVAAVKN